MPRGPVIDEHGLAQQVVGEPSDLERGAGISYDRQAVEDDLSDLSDVLSEAPAVQESRAPVCSAQSLASQQAVAQSRYGVDCWRRLSSAKHTNTYVTTMMTEWQRRQQR